MAEDNSFKKPGAIPFKWEVKPGVPKVQHHHKKQPPSLPQPPSPLQPRRNNIIQHRSTFSSSTVTTSPPPQKLKPPPSGSPLFFPTPEPRASSFRSTPRTRSDRWRFDQPVMTRRESVSSAGCFFSPLLRRKSSMIKRASSKPRADSLPDYTSELETLSRWSVSSRKSFVSPFRDSPSSSSYSSYQSSPRPVSDAEWAGFGLF